MTRASKLAAWRWVFGLANKVGPFVRKHSMKGQKGSQGPSGASVCTPVQPKRESVRLCLSPMAQRVAFGTSWFKRDNVLQWSQNRWPSCNGSERQPLYRAKDGLAGSHIRAFELTLSRVARTHWVPPQGVSGFWRPLIILK